MMQFVAECVRILGAAEGTRFDDLAKMLQTAVGDRDASGRLVQRRPVETQNFALTLTIGGREFKMEAEL